MSFHMEVGRHAGRQASKQADWQTGYWQRQAGVGFVERCVCVCV